MRGHDLVWRILKNRSPVEADLTVTDHSGADLRLANLTRVCTAKSNSSGAIVTGVDLNESDLNGAKFGELDLFSVDLTDARYDSSTRWPPGFSPPSSR